MNAMKSVRTGIVTCSNSKARYLYGNFFTFMETILALADYLSKLGTPVLIILKAFQGNYSFPPDCEL